MRRVAGALIDGAYWTVAPSTLRDARAMRDPGDLHERQEGMP
jgi:hypothetical protein